MINNNIVNITLYYGEDVREEEANSLCERLSQKYPNCEVNVIYGGQPVYYYLVALE